MSEERSLQEDALRFAEAVHEFAGSKGWGPDDYHIFIIIKTDIFILMITIVARAFEGRTEAQKYTDFSEVMDFLESRIKSEDHSLNYYTVALTDRHGYSFSANPNLWPGEIEVDEKLINRGVSWSAPFRIKPAAERV